MKTLLVVDNYGKERPRPKGYFHIRRMYERFADEYAIWYLWPFLKSKYVLRERWWDVLRWLERHNFIHYTGPSNIKVQYKYLKPWPGKWPR